MVSAVVGEEEEGGDGCLPDHAGDAVRLLFLGTVEPNVCRVGCQHDRLRGPRRFDNSRILERGGSGYSRLVSVMFRVNLPGLVASPGM